MKVTTIAFLSFFSLYLLFPNISIAQEHLEETDLYCYVNTHNEYVCHEVEVILEHRGGRVRKLTTSTGSHSDPNFLRKKFGSILQIPADKTIEILVGIDFSDKLIEFAVNGVLQEVEVSVNFFDEKEELLSTLGKEPMRSIVVNKDQKLVQKEEMRSSFQELSFNDLAVFAVLPDFSSLKINGSIQATMVVEFSCKNLNGKREIILSDKSPILLADRATLNE